MTDWSYEVKAAVRRDPPIAKLVNYTDEFADTYSGITRELEKLDMGAGDMRRYLVAKESDFREDAEWSEKNGYDGDMDERDAYLAESMRQAIDAFADGYGERLLRMSTEMDGEVTTESEAYELIEDHFEDVPAYLDGLDHLVTAQQHLVDAQFRDTVSLVREADMDLSTTEQAQLWVVDRIADIGDFYLDNMQQRIDRAREQYHQ